MSTLKDFQGLSVYILRFLDTYSEAIRRGEGTQRHTQIKNIFFICERYNILDLFDKRTNKEKYLAYINLRYIITTIKKNLKYKFLYITYAY